MYTKEDAVKTMTTFLVAASMLIIGMTAVQAQADCGGPGCGEVNCGLVKLMNVGPECATKGQEFQSKICVQAQKCVGDVRVTARVPEGLEFIKSDPPTREFGRQGGRQREQMGEQRLMWLLGDMDQCETKTIDITWKMLQTGTITQCVTIVAYPRACFTVIGVQPILEITKTGPETAMLGEMCTYTITVKNTGNSVVKDVKLTDNIPEGLQHSSGSPILEATFGDMAPGEERTCTVVLKAVKRGKHCNKAVVESSNAGKKEAQACTLVQVYDLAITKTGPKERFIGKEAEYTITVKNTGDVTMESLQLVDTAPAATTIVKAESAETTGSTATWMIKKLEPGKQETRTITLTSTVPGTHQNSATLCSPCGSINASAETLWRGMPAILLEVVDTDDPLQKDAETIYVIRVTNQGSEEDKNISIKAVFPKEIIPISVSGAMEGTVTGTKVELQPIPVLKPKEMIEMRIRAKGGEPGDGRVKVYLKSDLLATPVVEEESTHVY